MMLTLANNILALDLGEKRIGVALMRKDVSVPHALVTLHNNESTWQELAVLVDQHQIDQIVVGLPRNLQGQRTAQTIVCERFAQQVHEHFGLPVAMQDEALTSVEAEKLLKQSNKPYEKADIDALAASLILADYARSQGADV